MAWGSQNCKRPSHLNLSIENHLRELVDPISQLNSLQLARHHLTDRKWRAEQKEAHVLDELRLRVNGEEICVGTVTPGEQA
jgi:hypothetical protein